MKHAIESDAEIIEFLLNEIGPTHYLKRAFPDAVYHQWHCDSGPELTRLILCIGLPDKKGVWSQKSKTVEVAVLLATAAISRNRQPVLVVDYGYRRLNAGITLLGRKLHGPKWKKMWRSEWRGWRKYRATSVRQ